MGVICVGRNYLGTEGSGEIDFGFDFDDEERVGIGFPRRAKFALRFFERWRESGEDDFPIRAANEVEAAFLSDEFCFVRHADSAF